MNESGSGGHVAVDAHAHGATYREVYTSTPKMTATYRRALFARKPGIMPGVPMPRIETALPNVEAEPDRLAAYRALCGFPADGHLPITWPQVLAGPLHGEIITHPRFPLRAMGLVHVHQHIAQHRRIDDLEPLAIEAWLDGHEKTRRGIEFVIRTEVKVREEVVWEGATTVLYRRASKSKARHPKKRPPKSPGELPARTRSATVIVPESMGRRYAKVSGDFNPIHLYPMTAKLFGFKRAIAHGMWSMARCMAELDSDIPDGPVVVETDFKRPVFLPSKTLCTAGPSGREGVMEFELKSRNSKTIHLAGSIQSG